MSSFLSRTLTASFASAEELILAVENTKLMLTEQQRRMTRDALKASSDRFRDLVAIHGYGADMDDEVGAPIKHQFQLALDRRASDRAITVARREARIAKGQSRFVDG